MINLFLIWLGKTISFVIKTLHLGSGETWSGEIILKLNEGFLKRSAKKLSSGIIVISGTNGKTTTSLLITSILKKSGFNVLHNATGANLLNGIVASFIKNYNWSGKLKTNIAVLEVDEANLPKLLQHVDPNIVLLLNLSRDQLDRYGEVEIMVEKWKKSLSVLSKKATLILNKDDERIFELKNSFKGQTRFFSMEREQAWPFPLYGKFNKYNTLAAIEVAKCMNISFEIIVKSLKEFKPAFGRGEKFEYKKRKIQMFLAKNPASFNANLKMILQELKNVSAILFILNDNIPDGRDVSWIYDINSNDLFEVSKDKKIFISGTRDTDMALRLKYAGLNVKDMWYSHEIEKMIMTMVQQTEEGESCLVLPTYSAMLQSRKILIGKSIL